MYGVARFPIPRVKAIFENSPTTSSLVTANVNENIDNALVKAGVAGAHSHVQQEKRAMTPFNYKLSHKTIHPSFFEWRKALNNKALHLKEIQKSQ